MIRNKDGVTSDVNSLPRLDVENDEMIADKITNNTASNNEEQSGIELSESDLQLQVIDCTIDRCLKIYRYICIHTLYLVKS